MHVERLCRVIDTIQAGVLPDGTQLTFNMACWYSPSATGCGTRACIAGVAAIVAENEGFARGQSRQQTVGCWRLRDPWIDEAGNTLRDFVTTQNLARIWLELDEWEASRLFLPSENQYDLYTTAAGTDDKAAILAALLWMAEHQTINWSQALVCTGNQHLLKRIREYPKDAQG